MNQLNVSLWGDESFSAILAQKDLWGIITTVAKDTAPPLYYILLHFWINIFGTSEIAIRSFSIMLFFLLGIVVFAFTKELFNKKAAIFASALVLLNPIIFGYAFEGRMYMLLVLLTTCSMWFFKTKRWKLYILATTAALYTHHFALFILITQILYYSISKLYFSLQHRQYNFFLFLTNFFKSKTLLTFIVILVCYIPWIPVFIDQSQRVSSDFWLQKPEQRDFKLLYEHFLAGSTHLPQEDMILIFSIFLLVFRGFNLGKDGILYLWVIFPPLFTFVWSFLGRPLFFDRYLIISIPAIPILLASQNKKLLSPITNLLLIGVIIGLFFIDVHIFNHPSKQPFKEVAQYVYKTYGKNTTVINYYTNHLHYFELKYQGVNVKIYSPDQLPFWTGTALVDKQDILKDFPQDKQIIIMASGEIEKVHVPYYHEVKQEKFSDLYLFQYEKDQK
jgi:uncharacterized membrane protein